MKVRGGGIALRRAASERWRAASVFGAVLALIATVLMPVSAANAAPGDLAHGVVSVDANKNGVLDASGPAGEADKGLAGVVVNALDGGGNVVATTTTAADGSWSIKEADVSGDPAVRIEIVTSDANGNVYASYPATGGDNAFARAGSPDRATADFSGADVTLNALVYPVWKLDAKLADDPNGVGGKSILTGAPTFDADDSQPGNDSGTTNTRVRSADIVAFNWSLTAESEDGSLGSKFENAVFEQTITLKDGAVANFAGIPAVCLAGSTIVAQPSGTAIQPKTDPPTGTTSVTLSCVLGEMGVAPAPSAIILSTLVQPSAKSPNGSSFETSSRFTGVDAGGTATAQPAAGPEVPPIDITAAPRYDLEKSGPSAGYYGTQVIDGQNVAGQFAYYTIQISTDRQVGVEAFQQPLKIEESFWANRSVTGPNGETVGSNISDMKWYVTGCIPSPGGPQGQSGNGLVYGKPGYGGASATAANSVRDSGMCTYARTGAANTGNYELTLSGIDTSGLSYPTQTAAGQSLAAGPYYVASYRLQVFIPNSEMDRAQGDPSDGTGELSIFNRVGDFDPKGVSGASNFGSGVEPGYCDAGPTGDQATNCGDMEDGKRSNNVAGPVTIRVSAGNWGKYLFDITTGWAGGYTTLPDSGASQDGAGQVQPGQAYTSWITLQPSGIDFKNPQYCDVFDGTMLKAVELNKDVSASNPFEDGLYAAVLTTKNGAYLPVADQKARQGDWVVKYGTVDLSGDDPNNGTFDTPTNRYEGDWTKQRAATNGAGTACATVTSWTDTPTDTTNVVWVSSASPEYVLKAGEVARLLLAFEQRDEYNGGPHAGQKIPAGTVAANFAAVKTDTSYNPNWSSAGYIPGAGGTQPFSAGTTRQPGENGSVQGDRWTVRRAQMRLQKRTIAETIDGEASSGVANYGVTGAAVVGKPVVWEITSTLTASSNPAAPVNNVTITDTLPKYVVYNEAGTQALAASGGFPMPTSATPNADGTTTLVWSLGTRTPNQDLPVLKIATYTDAMAPPNTTAVNWANITADGIVPVSAHKDDHTIRIEQSGQVQLKKSVDRTLDLQDDNQKYTLEVKNFSETLAIQAPTVYDALPYTGDATNAANVNRTPESDYAGTSRLHEAPKAFDFDGTTERAGTFYYTTVPGAQVPQRQQDDTDPSIWSTTFTPNATGFKFVASSSLTTTANASKSGIKITFQTDQAGNDPGDIYTNRFTVISPTLNAGQQLLTSNTVTVRVVGFSLGDFIWFDVNGNGKYDAGTDRPAPEGVTVQVRNAAGAVVATTTTLGGDQAGRWVVNDLPAGDYYVTVPASQFAEDGPLAGATPAANPVLDPNTDKNEDVDHHAIADGAGVRSSGLITLSADTDADPIAGEEPLGDNVAGLTLAPLTTDDFTNLTLDLALVPPAHLTIEKQVDGEGAAYGTASFKIDVACVFDGKTVVGYPKTVTLKGAESTVLTAPLGSKCTATETSKGGATAVAVDAVDGVTLDSESGDFKITVTNTFDLGKIRLYKDVAGAGQEAGMTEGNVYRFDVVCAFNGKADAFVQRGVEIVDDGSGQMFTEIEGVPVGAECTISEVDNGGADDTPPAETRVIASKETTVWFCLENVFSAGTLEASKALAGPAKEDEFVKSLDYRVRVTCEVEKSGIRGEVYSAELMVKAGEKIRPKNSNGDPVLLPAGTHCWLEETVDQGAGDAAVNFDGWDHAAIVQKIGKDEPLQTLELTATNTFDQAELTVSKKVVGPGTGGAYDFELACTYPVQGEDGIEQADYPLAAGDAKFSLKDGEKKTVTVLAGVSCVVVETNLPQNATATIEDSDATTERGATDGIVTGLSGADNFVEVTNTFPNPPALGQTGAGLPIGALWAAAGLLGAGAVLFSLRRIRGGRRSQGARRPGAEM